MKSAVTFLLLTWSLLLLACSPAGNTHGSDAGLDSGNDVIGDSDTIDSDCCSDADTDSATDVIDATGLIDPDNPRISIKFINVGQGDATIISVPGGKTLIFDTGRKVSDGQHLGSLLWGLSPQEVILAVSHYDSDHMGAIEVLFSGPDGAPGVAGVDDDASGSADETTVAGEYGWPGSDDLLPALVLDRGLTYLPSTTDMDQYVAACEEVRQQPAPGDIIPMGLPELTVQVLAVNGILMDGTDVNPLYENDRSMVLLVTYGAFSLLLTGDLPSYTESLVAQQLFDQGIKLDVLHAGHHGSFTSTDPLTLDLLEPHVAVISVGNSTSCGAGFNAYGHPSQETITALWSADVSAVYQTEEGGATMATGLCEPATGETYPRDYHTMGSYFAGGDIELFTDGAQYSISTGTQTHYYQTHNPIPY